MKFSKLILISTLTLQGCSSLQQLDNLIESDYENGKPKELKSYNLMRDTIPCNLVHQGLQLNEDLIFVGNLGEDKALFQCRMVKHGVNDIKRAVLLGTEVDCETRLWDYSKSVKEAYKELGKLCQPNKVLRNKDPKFDNLYKSSKYLMDF